ncbi:hypothetical protein GCM10009000_103830 [Halobacterium noricense]
MRTLRDAATDADVHVGAAVDVDSLRTDTDYRETLAREFDAVTAENAMKWGPLADGERGYDFTDAADVSDADLFYNDYGADGFSAKSDEVYDLVARGVPIDGVGLQLHVFDDLVPPADVAANVERLTDLGLDVHITELDVGIGDAADDCEEQAEYYHDVVAAAVDAGVDTVVT